MRSWARGGPVLALAAAARRGRTAPGPAVRSIHDLPTPALGSTVRICPDEHTTCSPPRRLGERVRVLPSHVDPTVALHEVAHLVEGEDVSDTPPVDLRGR